ncbi:hypothetical protein H8959_011462 [Pygathrix nigripes]
MTRRTSRPPVPLRFGPRTGAPPNAARRRHHLQEALRWAHSPSRFSASGSHRTENRSPWATRPPPNPPTPGPPAPGPGAFSGHKVRRGSSGVRTGRAQSSCRGNLIPGQRRARRCSGHRTPPHRGSHSLGLQRRSLRTAGRLRSRCGADSFPPAAVLVPPPSPTPAQSCPRRGSRSCPLWKRRCLGAARLVCTRAALTSFLPAPALGEPRSPNINQIDAFSPFQAVTNDGFVGFHAGGRWNISVAGAGESQILCTHPRRPDRAEGRAQGNPGSRGADPPPTARPLRSCACVLDGIGWIHRKDADLCCDTGDQSPECSRNDCRRRVTPGRDPQGPPRTPAAADRPLRARRWPRIIASPVGFPDRGFLIGSGGSSAALLGIKLNIWTLSLSLSPPPSPAKKLKTKPGSRRPSPPRGLGGRRKTKVAAAAALSPESRLSSGIPGAPAGPRRADIKNRGLGKRRRPAFKERSPGSSGLGRGEGAFLPTLPGAHRSPARPSLF